MVWETQQEEGEIKHKYFEQKGLFERNLNTPAITQKISIDTARYLSQISTKKGPWSKNKERNYRVYTLEGVIPIKQQQCSLATLLKSRPDNVPVMSLADLADRD